MISVGVRSGPGGPTRVGAGSSSSAARPSFFQVRMRLGSPCPFWARVAGACGSQRFPRFRSLAGRP